MKACVLGGMVIVCWPIVVQWQCSVISTITDFFQPNKKYPIAAPITTPKHNHILYVIKINISRKLNVTCTRWRKVWYICIIDVIFGLKTENGKRNENNHSIIEYWKSSSSFLMKIFLKIIEIVFLIVWNSLNFSIWIIIKEKIQTVFQHFPSKRRSNNKFVHENYCNVVSKADYV